MRGLRFALAAVGIACGSYGGWLLVERRDDLIAVGTWLIGGVLLHDAVVAPVVILMCLVGAYVLPSKLQREGAVGLVVFGSLTLIGIPVLGRFGAKADNATLLDRNYFLGWLLLGTLTLAGCALFAALSPAPATHFGEASEEEPEEV